MLSQLRTAVVRAGTPSLRSTIARGLFIPCFPSPSIPAPSSVDDYDWEKRRQIGLKKYEKIWTPEAVEEACRKNALLTWMPSGGGISENIIGASGCYFYTSTGDKVLDMSSSAVCVNGGYTPPPGMTETITDALKTLPYVHGVDSCHPLKAKVSDLLASIMPGDLNAVTFTSGGAEANETAINIAKNFTKKQKIMTRYRSYHGSFGRTICMTGDPRSIPSGGHNDIIKFMDPWPYYFSFGKSEEEVTRRSIELLQETIMYEGPQTIAAIVMESVTGTNGILIPPKGYLEGVRALCDKYDILMMCDEVMAGFGRTGKLFGFMHTEPMIIPDLVTFAKGVNGAFLPLGGVAMRQKVHDFFQINPIGTGTTYTNHPVTLASAYAYLKTFLEEDYVGLVEEKGKKMKSMMEQLAANHACIKHQRSVGLFGLFDFQINYRGDPFAHYNSPAHPAMLAFKKKMREDKIYTMYRWSCMHVCPPFVISDSEMEYAFDVFDKNMRILDDAMEE
eukprot:TRINITY_DN3884_c0_g1_i1.p1 TRINITY_DN3884_c0_g1~~TRINITY_DN3884_c0_g1_i1.p1  ORF type:complete len:504 (+),score=104.08 TRINITY_DN3884_c0_g1_i1:77-1588(+)